LILKNANNETFFNVHLFVGLYRRQLTVGHKTLLASWFGIFPKAKKILPT